MVNQQLIDYIKAQRTAGVTRPDLEKALAAAGWPAADIAGGFAAADGVVPPAPAAPAAPVRPAQPVQPAAPLIQPFQARPVQPVQPTSVQPISTTTMQMNVQGAPRRSFGLMWSMLAIVVLLAVAAGAAYMFIPAVHEVVGFYLGTAPAPVTQEVATTTPPNIQTDAANGYSVTLPTGVTLAPISVYQETLMHGEIATSSLPAGSMEAANLFVVSKIPSGDIARGKEVYDYVGGAIGTRYWFDASSTAFKAEKIGMVDSKTTFTALPLATTTSAGTVCTLARKIGPHTFYRIASGDEGVPTIFFYFLPLSDGTMLRFMSKVDLDSGGADIAATLASLTLSGAGERTVQCQ